MQISHPASSLTLPTLTARLRQRYSPGEARAIVLLVMEKVFGVAAIDVYADKVRQFSANETALLHNILNRLEAGEPVQYVIGEADFCGHVFRVKPGVLIPRPETEDVVSAALHILRAAKTDKPRILDAGTGSGCIACTLALAMPQAEVTAWDVSEEALQTAIENARQLGAANVSAAIVDLLRPFEPPSAPFDLIVSNPPYVLHRESRDIAPHVHQHEPHLALYVPDQEPLLFYERLAALSKTHLTQGGSLVVEVNEAFGQATADCFINMGLQQVSLMQDRFGKDRIITACKS